MKRLISMAIVCSSSFLLHAQEKREHDSTQKFVQLNEVVISANKFEEKKKNVAQKIDIISSGYIGKVNAQNTGDLLSSTGNIFVQKSQQGGSSPVIRGFEASRVLLVVDGVRMNNLIYRAGHLQNAITVDQSMLERVEILYGPASTLYGSDALGGVIHFITRQPQLAASGKNLNISGGGFTRYSTVNDEKTVHIHVNLGLKKWAWLQSYTYSDFGDMKMGNKYRDEYPDFGRRSEYIATINGIDSVVKNSDDRVQKLSGYKQWDILEKILYQQSDKVSHTLNIQFSNTTNVPRYDRLQDIRNRTLRYAEWYYGPQERFLVGYELNAKNLSGFFNQVRVNLNGQQLEESRQTRDYRRYDRFDSRVEKVKVGGFVVDARKLFNNHELSIGLDGQLNDLKSTASRINILTGAKSKLDTRYPDGKNKMNNFGLYAQHTFKMNDGKIVINDGIRLQTIHLHSTILDNSFFNLPFTEIDQDNFAVTGNAGIIFLPGKATKISTVFATGFRAPNVDDNAKIFESSTGAKQVVIPNADLKPEYTYNIDLGISQVFAEKIKFEVTGFYTWFTNAIIKAPFRLNGQDSILYNGVTSQVLANQNRNKAYLYGFSSTLATDINEHLSVMSSINFTKGRYNTNPGETSNIYQKQPDGTYQIRSASVSSKPLDHIPPVFGKTSIQYRAKQFITEAYAIYNGWKRLDKFNADGEDNAQYATADGMPSWCTLNWRGTYNFTNSFNIQVGIENILDRNYRYFASGFSAPGRNFIFTVRGNF